MNLREVTTNNEEHNTNMEKIRRKPDTLGKVGAIFGIVYSAMATFTTSFVTLILGMYFLTYFVTSTDIYFSEIVVSVIVMGTLLLFDLLYISSIIVFALYIPGIIDNKIIPGVLGILTSLIPGILIFISKQETPEGYDDSKEVEERAAKAAAKAEAKAAAKAEKEANPVEGSGILVKIGAIWSSVLMGILMIFMVAALLVFVYAALDSVIFSSSYYELNEIILQLTMYFIQSTFISLFILGLIYLILENVNVFLGKKSSKTFAGIFGVIFGMLPGILILIGEYNQKEEYVKEVEESETQGPGKVGIIGSVLGMLLVLLLIPFALFGLFFSIYSIDILFNWSQWDDNGRDLGFIPHLILFIEIKLATVGGMFLGITPSLIIVLSYLNFIRYIIGKSESKTLPVAFGFIAGIIPGVLILVSDYNKKQKEE